nr:1-acylglycerol-3-phosphate o-acyltransferase [Quercus suber]
MKHRDGIRRRRHRHRKIKLSVALCSPLDPHLHRSHHRRREASSLSLVKTPYVQEKVDIGSGPPGSKIRWFRSKSNESRNFDALAKRFRVIAIYQLGWGGSSRPNFTCKSTEETETWFIDSFEEWRKAKNLSNFILLGHSFGGYVAAKYALKQPEHVQHLILVGPAGFSSDSDPKYETLTRFRATWKGAILNHLWESNFTPMKVVRGLGPWGPNIVHKYTSARYGTYATGNTLTEEESRLLTVPRSGKYQLLSFMASKIG